MPGIKCFLENYENPSSKEIDFAAKINICFCFSETKSKFDLLCKFQATSAGRAGKRIRYNVRQCGRESTQGNVEMSGIS